VTDLGPHQTPWFHELFCGPASGDASTNLGEAIAAIGAPRAVWLRRCVALVGGDNGFWREERLIEGLDGSVVLEIDSHRGRGPHQEPLPAELSKDYERLVAFLRDVKRTWPITGGLHREPNGRPKGGEMVVVVDAAIAEGRALLGESAVTNFRKVVFPGLDVSALKP
jgi:hypothetical protein